MKKKFSLLIMSFLCALLIFYSAGFNSEAKSCRHKFDNDICKKCGFIRIHEFDESILFYTIKDNVPIWSKPTKNSELLKEISDKDTMIDIDGILRNQYGNIWLRVSGEGYVYVENIYLNFESLVVCSWQRITALGDEAAPLWFFYEVSPDGPADYKRWLDPSSKGIIYKVKVADEFYDMTAEELGNINYGYLGKLMGFPDDILLYAGGTLNVTGKFGFETFTNTYKALSTAGEIIKECSISYCDAEDDAENVKRGIRYYTDGEFE